MIKEIKKYKAALKRKIAVIKFERKLVGIVAVTDEEIIQAYNSGTRYQDLALAIMNK